MQNLGDNGDRGSKFVVESAVFRIADRDLPIHYATFIFLNKRQQSDQSIYMTSWPYMYFGQTLTLRK